MTGRVLRLYFSNCVYYGLERQSVAARLDMMDTDDVVSLVCGKRKEDGYNQQPKEVDNPNQRISEDICSFTEFSLSFFLTLVTAAIDLICFSVILFSILPELFLAILLFAYTGTALTVCTGRVLI